MITGSFFITLLLIRIVWAFFQASPDYSRAVQGELDLRGKGIDFSPIESSAVWRKGLVQGGVSACGVTDEKMFQMLGDDPGMFFLGDLVIGW